MVRSSQTANRTRPDRTISCYLPLHGEPDGSDVLCCRRKLRRTGNLLRPTENKSLQQPAMTARTRALGLWPGAGLMNTVANYASGKPRGIKSVWPSCKAVRILLPRPSLADQLQTTGGFNKRTSSQTGHRLIALFCPGSVPLRSNSSLPDQLQTTGGFNKRTSSE